MDVTFIEEETFYPSPTTKLSLQGEFQDEEVNWIAITCLESEGKSEQHTTGNTEIRSNHLKEPCNMEYNETLEEPFNIECNETPTLVSNMPSSDATSDGSPSLVPDGLSLENITEVNSPAIFFFTDNVNSIVHYVLPFRHNRGKPPS